LLIAQLTDLHLGSTEALHLGLNNRRRFLNALAAARAHHPDLLFLTGDLSLRDPDPIACHWLAEQLRELGTPVYFLAGNHDDPRMLREIFQLPGALTQSLDYSFQREGLDIIALDTSMGELQPGQLAWLAQQLAVCNNPVIFMHHPPGKVGSAYMDQNHALRNAQPLLDILFADGRPIDIFCGHYHLALTTTLRNLTIHVAPPTSFSIDPRRSEFAFEALPPAYQLISWRDEQLAVMPRYLNEGTN